MKILVLGGDGMFGHQFFKHVRPRHDVHVTLRQPLSAYREFGLFDEGNAIDKVDAQEFERVEAVVRELRPDAVVNAVGIVKQRHTAKESIPSIEINALLPHQLAQLCRTIGARLVHLSTDCVFSGEKGMYAEQDTCDASDLYGRSKLLGEVDEEGTLTLRTSIIGPELSRKTGLLEWVLAQRGQVRGFKRAIFSGFTTLELSRIVEMLLMKHPQAHGLYHVSSEAIDKYTLLCLINEAFDLGLDVVPDEAVRIDRSLDSTRFRREFGYTPPAWPDMIQEVARSHGSAKSASF